MRAHLTNWPVHAEGCGRSAGNREGGPPFRDLLDVVNTLSITNQSVDPVDLS